MKPLIEFFADALQDHRGGTSATRILSFLVVVDIMAMWNIKLLEAGGWLPMDPQMLLLVFSVLGLASVKSVLEGKGGPPTP